MPIDSALKVVHDILQDPTIEEHQIDMSMVGPAVREIMNDKPRLATSLYHHVIGRTHKNYPQAIEDFRAEPQRIAIFKKLVGLS